MILLLLGAMQIILALRVVLRLIQTAGGEKIKATSPDFSRRGKSEGRASPDK
jgi:hypothetical protein